MQISKSNLHVTQLIHLKIKFYLAYMQLGAIDLLTMECCMTFESLKLVKNFKKKYLIQDSVAYM